MTADAGNPSGSGRLLRSALKQSRLSAGFTQDQVAAALDWKLSKVARIESGLARISITDLRAMLGHYDVIDRDRVAELVTMARAARQQRPWWEEYGNVASRRYLQFVEYEQAAESVLHFRILFLPGILQTRQYAEAIVWTLNHNVTAARAEGLVEFRMKRQEILDAPTCPDMTFVLDESVVQREVGSAEVMQAQYRRLVDLASRPNIHIQIYPFAAGLVYGMETPFVLHTFADSTLDVLYLERPRGDTLVAENVDEISRYRHAFAELRDKALSASESMEHLEELADRR